MRGATARRTHEMNNESSRNENTAAIAEPGATVTSEKAPSKQGAIRKNGTPKGNKSRKRADAKKQSQGAPKAKATTKKAAKPALGAKEPKATRNGSKKAIVLEFLHRKQGATLAEIMKATSWQA